MSCNVRNWLHNVNVNSKYVVYKYKVQEKIQQSDQKKIVSLVVSQSSQIPNRTVTRHTNEFNSQLLIDRVSTSHHKFTIFESEATFVGAA